MQTAQRSAATCTCPHDLGALAKLVVHFCVQICEAFVVTTEGRLKSVIDLMTFYNVSGDEPVVYHY